MKKIMALLITFLFLVTAVPVNAATSNWTATRKSPVYTISQRFRSEWFQEWLKARRERIEKERQEKETIETPVEEPVEEPAEEPVAPPAEEPVAPPVEEPVAPPVEEPVAPPAEEPVAPPVEEPVAPPAENQEKNVLDYGAKGDGSSNDTAAIQAALDTGENVFIPDGTYRIDVDQPLKPVSGQNIQLSENAILKALPSANGYHAVIRLLGVSDVSISGGKIIGERYEHQGSSGEWGMGIHIIKGSSHINISNVMISDFWGDGIFIGDSPTVTDVVIDNVVSDNNRRQGISITDAKRIVIKNSVFKNTNGTLPEAGIDIEPDAGQSSEDIEITNVTCEGNSGSGIDLMGITGPIKNVRISECKAVNNTGMGLKLVKSRDVSIANSQIDNNLYGIEIQKDIYNASFSNVTVSNNQRRGLSIVTSDQAEGVEKIYFENSVFSNNSQVKSGKYDGVRIDTWDSTGYIKDVKFTACQFIDDQAVKSQGYGMTVGFNDKISEIVYDQQSVFSGNINGDLVADRLILHLI